MQTISRSIYRAMQMYSGTIGHLNAGIIIVTFDYRKLVTAFGSFFRNGACLYAMANRSPAKKSKSSSTAA